MLENISVTVFKEGDRSVQVRIPVQFNAAYAQAAWGPFLNHIMHELKLEDIEGVYEDIDGAPVARIASLVDGGVYFARPTEVSAMLRSLVREEHECYPAWPSVEEGLEAKRELVRCREYYERHLLTMALGSPPESQALAMDPVLDAGDGVTGFLWTMKVKQGFKCKVFKSPECRAEEVLDTLPMGSIVTLSTDWGEILEKHPLRGKKGKGKVLWMVDPQEGFVERRPLEDFQREAGAPEVVAPVPAAATVLTADERLEIIRGTDQVSEILRSALRRGVYFQGAAAVHDNVAVHRAALRAAATLMRKDPASREVMLECKGIELFVLLVNRFGEKDRLLCEYGCWAFAVFAGEGDSRPRDSVFQRALVEAGGLEAIGGAVEAHRESASLRRYCVGALAATVHDNAAAAGKLHSLGLHVVVAEEAIRRWPTNPELSCLSCWVLRSAVGPSPKPTRKGSPAGGGRGSVVEGRDDDVAGGGFGPERWSVAMERGEVAGEAAMHPLGGDTRGGDSDRAEGYWDKATDDSSVRAARGVSSSKGLIFTGWGSDSGGGGGGSGSGSGSVFAMADNETSDLLIGLDGSDEDDDATTRSAGMRTEESLSGRSKGAHLTVRTADSGGAEEAGGKEDVDSFSVEAMFEGERDEGELERLLKLAEATKVMNHDNEGTRKAASALVGALLRQIDLCCASGTRRRREATKGRVARVLREGQALGAL